MTEQVGKILTGGHELENAFFLKQDKKLTDAACGNEKDEGNKRKPEKGFRYRE